MAMADDDFAHQLELEERERQLKENASSSQSHTYVDPNDGTCYEWDADKKAWFPKITDDFMAAYQANYGQHQTATTAEQVTPQPPAVENKDDNDEKGAKAKANASGKPEQPGWFEVDDKHNTNVYVSNLPTDITEEEFVEFMSKCGIIMKDADTGKLKVKLYTDANGQLKGDGRCCYIKVESVELALNILDGYMLKDKEVKVERATFQLKGTYDPSKKPRKRKAKDKYKIAKMQTKLLDWKPERPVGLRPKSDKVVIVKNMFDVKEFENDASLILEYQTELREECSKYGVVKKVVVYDRHPEGIASVSFKEPEMADECISAINGRWFAGRQLQAATFDGKSKYSIEETLAEEKERMSKWESYLEKGEAKST